MWQGVRRQGWWIATGCAVGVLGAVAIARLELGRLREAFETDARITHRVLSQRVVQHDAVLATLALLQPAAEAAPPEQRLSSVYPQILSVRRRDRDGTWPDEALRAAEAKSREARRPALAGMDLANGRYQLVLGADPTSFALAIDLPTVVPWSEWPMDPAASRVRVTLDHAGQSYVVQPGRAGFGQLGFEFHKALATESQPFTVSAVRQIDWPDLPWLRMLAWVATVALLLGALLAWQRQRAERRRAEELLRLGQVARLNTLGELAAGMAHELNQPLTAVLANTQAAARLLNDEPPELDTARHAMTQASEQARRASDVVARLRRAVERPNQAAPLSPVALQEAVRNALYLLEPECRRRAVTPQLQAPSVPVVVQADPVALEQIIHNLLLNALQALDGVTDNQRQLTLAISADSTLGTLRVIDTGPGIPPDVLPRLFEPFFSTREGGLGLGLGLSLCETLATGMGGRLAAEAHTPRGAVFVLSLPLHAGTAA